MKILSLACITLALFGACATPKVGPAPDLSPVRHYNEVAHKHIQETRQDINTGQIGLKAVDQDLQNLLKGE